MGLDCQWAILRGAASVNIRYTPFSSMPYEQEGYNLRTSLPYLGNPRPHYDVDRQEEKGRKWEWRF